MVNKLYYKTKTKENSFDFKKIEETFVGSIYGKISKTKNFSLLNDFMRSFFDSEYRMLVFLDEDFNYIKVNKTYADFWQKSPEYFTGKNYFDVFPDGSGKKKVIQILKFGNSYFRKEKKLIHPQRGVIFCDWRAEPIKGRDGEVFGFILDFEDVTERKIDRIEMKRKSRALNVIRKCNKAIIHSTNEISLLREVSRIIVGNGKYDLIWAGFSEHNQRKPHSFVGAQSRDGVDWFRSKISKSLNEYAQKIGVPKNILGEGSNLDRRKNNESNNNNSVVLSIKVHQSTIGSLRISPRKGDVFDDAEKKLFRELAKNLSYGIERLQEKKEKEEAEKRLVDLYRYLGVINRKISILMDLEKPQPKQGGRKITNYILNSTVNLSGAKVGALYRYKEEDKVFEMFASKGFEGKGLEEIGVVKENDAKKNNRKIFAKRESPRRSGGYFCNQEEDRRRHCSFFVYASDNEKRKENKRIYSFGIFRKSGYNHTGTKFL